MSATFATFKNPRRLACTQRELVTFILKHHGIHDGKWRLAVGFGQPVGVNASVNDPDTHCPAVLVPVVHIAAFEADSPADMVVDAAEVNPRVVN